MSSSEVVKKQNQKTILLLIFAFVAPAMIAWLQFEYKIFSSGTNNYGEFISPPVALKNFELVTQDKKKFELENIKGNWHLVYFGKGQCAEVCRNRLSTMHQTRMAQGKAMSRVRLLYVALDGIEKNISDKLKKDYSRLTVLTGKEEETKGILKQFETGTSGSIREDNMIFMVDPLGNLMMRYKKEIRLIGIIKDLEHLLKISQIG